MITATIICFVIVVAIGYMLCDGGKLYAALKASWDDIPHCAWCGKTSIYLRLDGDDLCRSCCNTWGDHYD